MLILRGSLRPCEQERGVILCSGAADPPLIAPLDAYMLESRTEGKHRSRND